MQQVSREDDSYKTTNIKDKHNMYLPLGTHCVQRNAKHNVRTTQQQTWQDQRLTPRKQHTKLKELDFFFPPPPRQSDTTIFYKFALKLLTVYYDKR